MAIELEVPGAKDANLEAKEIIAMLANAVAIYPRRLFVLDNVDSNSAFNEVKPLVNESDVIVTSIFQGPAFEFAGLKLDIDHQYPLDADSATNFLLRRSARPRTEEPDAHKVGRKLGWHMLALEQAAAYAKVCAISFAEYLRR